MDVASFAGNWRHRVRAYTSSPILNNEVTVMRESRRIFLGLAFATAVAAAAGASPQLGSTQEPTAENPVPGIHIPPLPKHGREELRANQAAIKKDVARLNELVGELQKGLDDSDTKQVLSLDVIHKTEEIEKLAKQIRELVRG
jgi:hypothetical protein